MKVKIIKAIYKVVKTYILKEAKATGNKEFEDKVTAALEVIEDVFDSIVKNTKKS